MDGGAACGVRRAVGCGCGAVERDGWRADGAASVGAWAWAWAWAWAGAWAPVGAWARAVGCGMGWDGLGVRRDAPAPPSRCRGRRRAGWTPRRSRRAAAAAAGEGAHHCEEGAHHPTGRGKVRGGEGHAHLQQLVVALVAVREEGLLAPRERRVRREHEGVGVGVEGARDGRGACVAATVCTIGHEAHARRRRRHRHGLERPWGSREGLSSARSEARRAPGPRGAPGVELGRRTAPTVPRCSRG